MIVSYRQNGMAKSRVIDLQDVRDLQLAFNRVVVRLDLSMDTITKNVRYEGRVKINRRKYAAISQGGLIVVQGGPDIPERIELRT